MRVFDVNPEIIDPEELNAIVEKKRQTLNPEVYGFTELKNKSAKGLFKLHFGVGGKGKLKNHEYFVLEQKLKRIDEDIVLLNNIFDINRYGVHGSGFPLLVKRIMWKLTRIFLKPLISSVSYYNYHVRKTLSDIKNVLDEFCLDE